MPEVSSIKVDPTKVKLKEKPKFSYNTAAYDSYAKEGFTPPDIYKRPDKWEQRFLSKVDLNQGKIKVKILNMMRQLGIDYSSEKQERREYLTFTSDWAAKNYQEVDIFCRGHVEGFHFQQRKQLATKKNYETGEVQAPFEKAAPREVFTIPFSKKNVDEILYGAHPFGPDSINITDYSNVLFYGKITNQLGVMNFRCADYTYEQFITPEWKQFVEWAVRPGGPANRKPIPEKQRYIA